MLITGESGTGKELIARAVHYAGERADKPFVPINCGALPESLIEDELFGHERGAFSGATETRSGRFEAANHGTIFLDEIGELPIDAQAKLLRAVQFGEVQRLGADRPAQVNVRVVAATHHDLEARADEGSFRRDLFYRLSVLSIRVPPLRERRVDIPLLAAHFLKELAAAEQKDVRGFAPEVLERFLAHDWPGNVRELRNVVHRAVLCAGTGFGPELLPAGLGAKSAGDPEAGADGDRALAAPAASPKDNEELKLAREQAVATVEKAFLEDALRRTNGNASEAARLTGVTRTYFHRLLKRHGVRAHRFKD